MLSRCQCLFEQTGATLAFFQPENLQNVQKMCFWQKKPARVNELKQATA